MVVFDSGNGPELYAIGFFASDGIPDSLFTTGPLAGVARWNGVSWQTVGTARDGFWPGVVRDLAVFDDGSGPELYVVGDFGAVGGVSSQHLIKWNGSRWARPSQVVGGFSLAVFDDGGGPALYIGFGSLRKFDGSTLTTVGTFGSGQIRALAVHDDGSGPALFAAGNFGIPASNVARWDGSSWSPLGSGTNGTVWSLTSHDDGNGPALYACGDFTSAGGVPSNRVARWDGTSWSALGSGLDLRAITMTSCADFGGPALYVAGNFGIAGGVPANGIARWSGGAWSPIAVDEMSWSGGLGLHDDGNGPALFAHMTFPDPPGEPLSMTAKWDGATWEGLARGPNGPVAALAVDPGGDGREPRLYAGGDFTVAGTVRAIGVASWDGTGWSPLGAGTVGPVHALALHDENGDGTPELFAGGAFSDAGSVEAYGIGRWDGASWSPVENGVWGTVEALAVFDDGDGPALHAGGNFLAAGDVPASHIAKWDGVSWSPLGIGTNAPVRALAVFDDGTGPALYATGDFTSAGGWTVSHIARWDGLGWTPVVGSGLSASTRALAVLDLGDGPELYLGGLSSAGVSLVRRWDGLVWSTIGGDFSYFDIEALGVLDDGAGVATLFAGGDFRYFYGPSRLARWDGTAWMPVGSGVSSGMNAPVLAMTAWGDGSGPGSALIVGGHFTGNSESGDNHLARLQACPDVEPPTLSHPAAIYVVDVSPDVGEHVTFSVTARDNADPSPEVVCEPPSGSLFPPGITTVTCTATDAAGNTTTGEFAVVVQPKVRRRNL